MSAHPTPDPRPAPYPLTAAELVEGVIKGDRGRLARAITLAESALPTHRALIREVLAALPDPGASGNTLPPIIGVTGPPGAGKSTLIEALGLHYVGQGERLAVLAVDPSSPVAGGSILGDRTRMDELSRHPLAYVRPMPSRAHLGGLAPATLEALTLCRAAGYTRILIESVGVGQSEIEVTHLSDLMLLVLPPASGDELQGIKKGIVETADLVSINKADGPTRALAEATVRHYRAAVSLTPPPPPAPPVPVLMVSAQTGEGISALADALDGQARQLAQSGLAVTRARARQTYWAREYLRRAWLGELSRRLDTPQGQAIYGETFGNLAQGVGLSQLAVRAHEGARALLGLDFDEPART